MRYRGIRFGDTRNVFVEEADDLIREIESIKRIVSANLWTDSANKYGSKVKVINEDLKACGSSLFAAQNNLDQFKKSVKTL